MPFCKDENIMIRNEWRKLKIFLFGILPPPLLQVCLSVVGRCIDKETLKNEKENERKRNVKNVFWWHTTVLRHDSDRLGRGGEGGAGVGGVERENTGSLSLFASLSPLRSRNLV